MSRTLPEDAHPARSGYRPLIGAAAVLFPLLYVLSDVLELMAGGLYPAQLWVTYVAEAGVPFFVLGLDAYQQPRAGLLGLLGAVAYGASFVGFSATVLYPLVTGVRDADQVFAAFGPIYTAHAVLALLGGGMFGAAVLRARVYPRWTGAAVIAGLIFSLVLIAFSLPEAIQTAGTALRCAGFAGMGITCLRGRTAV
jgi:hypothetical protein